MKTFSSLADFGLHLAKLSLQSSAALETGLEASAKLIEKDAKEEIGNLQPAVGPFPAWDELAESTKRDKERQGYVFNDEYNPLLRDGELRDSYQHEVKGMEAVVGSKSDIAAYQEFGTATIPERPVLGPAAFKNKEKIKKIIGGSALVALLGPDSPRLNIK